MTRFALKAALCVLTGIVLFIFFSTFFKVKYDTVGSLDIFSGAIIEFFLFTLLLDLFHNRQQKVYKRALTKHLEEIEKLLKEKRDSNEF